MLTTFGLALAFVWLAEMGDKTQLLALGFASRYRWQTVLAGVAVATVLNHLLAVLAGHFLTRLVPVAWIQLLAAFSFLAFAVWTLHDDTAPEESAPRRWGPFLTVAVAFFLAEMGDKTQLMTLNLSVDQSSAAGNAAAVRLAAVWLGSTTGMILADALGMAVGLALHKTIPTRIVKWVAAAAFAVFGLIGLRAALDRLRPDAAWFHLGAAWALAAVMAGVMVWVGRRNARRASQEAPSPGGP